MVFADRYLPGYKSGGPIASISRIVASEREHDVCVITRDRDAGDSQPYPDLHPRTWTRLGGANVTYLRPGYRDWPWVISEIRRWKPDLYYVNSLQSPLFALHVLLQLRVGSLPQAPVLLAPRGECSTGAQALKPVKKQTARPYIQRLIGSQVTWHASSDLEMKDVLHWWGAPLPAGHRFIVRPDPAVPPQSTPSPGSGGNTPVVVFASRIDPMKGLDQAIHALSRVRIPVEFRIFGAIADQEYWTTCERLLSQLPSHVSSRYLGTFSPRDVEEIFGTADLMILPTKGENFGHVIAEALATGCPAGVSTRTLWSDTILAGSGCVTNDAQELALYIEHLASTTLEQRVSQRQAVLSAYRSWFAENDPQDSIFDLVLAP